LCDADGQVFNAASGQPVSSLTLVNISNSLRATSLPSQFELARPEDVLHSAGDSRHIVTRLGFKAEIPVVEGLREPVVSE
jgi:UDP-glucose 4-epimerase